MESEDSDLEEQYITVGEYEYMEKDVLGFGAEGEVYKGRKINNPDDEVAIKIRKINMNGISCF